MKLNVRIAILVGLACVIAAVLYFRVFQPPPVHAGIPVNFEDPAARPFELVMNSPADADQPQNTRIPAPAPEAAPPTRRLAAPSLFEPQAKTSATPVRVTIPLIEPEQESPADPVIVQVPEKPAEPQPRTYTVKSGDSLWRIARDQLGDASRHLELARFNEATLHGDPDNLRVGQELLLPPK